MLSQMVFDGDGICGPNEGMREAELLEAMAGNGLAVMVASFRIICNTCVGVLENHVLKFLEGAWLDVQLPIKTLAHLVLHLVDLLQLEHALADNEQ